MWQWIGGGDFGEWNMLELVFVLCYLEIFTVVYKAKSGFISRSYLTPIFTAIISVINQGVHMIRTGRFSSHGTFMSDLSFSTPISTGVAARFLILMLNPFPS